MTLHRIASDWTGLTIAVLGIAWGLITAANADSDGGARIAGLYAATAGAYVGARLLTRLDAAVVPLALVAIGATVVLVASTHRVYSTSPRGGPFGYSSVTGAFYLQCAFAAGLLVLDRRIAVRVIGVVAACAFVVVPFATNTRTAIATLVLVPIAFLVKRAVGARAAIFACAVVLTLAIVTTVAIAVSYSGADAYDDGPHQGLDRVIDATISLRRVEFQHDAVTMMIDHALVGVGPGRFAELSEAVARDPDEPWAHDDFLQHGAEAGVLGFALVTALFLWAFLRLRSAVIRRNRSILVATAVAALGVHACVEYVLQRPVLPAVTAALVGSAVASHRRHGQSGGVMAGSAEDR